MSNADKFWFVWCPAGRAPTHKHSTLHSATAEAERLARVNPGDEFVVLESVAACRRYDVQWTRHEPGSASMVEDSDDDDLPF